ncbi:hypothetical protein FRB95_003391 [Tulasnella sp. JGI-2019a]|nr:hypothetical protein FRB95_003391 [Tulasnella sp. JGI-2019a]
MNDASKNGSAAPVTPLRPVPTPFKWSSFSDTTGAMDTSVCDSGVTTISTEITSIEHLEIRPAMLFQTPETKHHESPSLDVETTPLTQLSVSVEALTLADAPECIHVVSKPTKEELRRLRASERPLPMSRGLCNSALEHSTHGGCCVGVAGVRMMSFLRQLPLKAFDFNFDVPDFGRLHILWSNEATSGGLMGSPRVVCRTRRCLANGEYGSVAIGFILPASGRQAQGAQHLVVPCSEWPKKQRYLPQGWREMLLASAPCGIVQLAVLERFGVPMWLQSGGPETSW